MGYHGWFVLRVGEPLIVLTDHRYELWPSQPTLTDICAHE
jgi:hypothetical protein